MQNMGMVALIMGPPLDHAPYSEGSFLPVEIPRCLSFFQESMDGSLLHHHLDNMEGT